MSTTFTIHTAYIKVTHIRSTRVNNLSLWLNCSSVRLCSSSCCSNSWNLLASCYFFTWMANVQYPGPVRGRLRPIQVDELQAGAEQAAQDVQVPRGDVEVLPAPVQPPQPAENQGAQLVGQAILPAQAQQFPPAQVPAQQIPPVQVPVQQIPPAQVPVAPQEAVHVEPAQGELEVNAFRLHVFRFMLCGVFVIFRGFFPLSSSAFTGLSFVVNSSSVLNLDLGGFFPLFLSSLVS